MVAMQNTNMNQYPWLRKQREGDSFEFVFPSTVTVEPMSPEESDKSLLIFLPGIDGVGWFAEPQFEDLARNFELRCFQLFKNDRSDFDALVHAVAAFIKDWQERSGGKAGKAILLGESFGGTLALGIAQEYPQLLQGLVLANPATSIANASIVQLAPFLLGIPDAVPMANTPLPDFLKQLPDPFGLLDRSPLIIPNQTLGNLAYAALSAPLLGQRVADEFQVQKLTGMARGRVEEFVRDAIQGGRPLEATEGLVKQADEALESLLSILPPATIRHRLDKLLLPGAKKVLSGVENVSVPVLLLAGDKDNLLPSSEETRRLYELLPNCKRVVAGGAGHLVLDERVNVTAMLLDSPVAPSSLRFDAVRDFKEPSVEEQKQAYAALDDLRAILSPVFFSTDAASGKVVSGLGGLPKQETQTKPIIFVGNHQALALDIGFLVGEVKMQTGVLMRGLAHPFLFGDDGSRMGSLPGMSAGSINGTDNVYRKFGAVPVSSRNAFKLLTSGDNVLLFPGGLKETMPRDGDPYKLLWPEKNEFVRLAAKANATIVPFGGFGAAELFNIVASIDQVDALKRSPLRPLLPDLIDAFGTRPSNSPLDLTRWSSIPDAERLKFPSVPLVLPAPPPAWPRMYFYFGAPIDTSDLDPKDEAEADRVYKEVKNRVEGCIDYLKRKRSSDPYAAIAPRIAYERINGEQAPTFDP